MVEEISPAYYAEVTADYAPFEIFGAGFDELPADAVGLLSVDNDKPLMYREISGSRYLQTIIEKSDTRMLMQGFVAHTFSNIYLGAILSADKSVVYWVNTSRPLP